MKPWNFATCALLFVSCGSLSFESRAHAVEPKIDLDSYLATLESRQVSTIEDAIAALPEELRANYALVYQGRSLREATPQKPAALLFGMTGKFIVTFNSADQRTGNTLEFLQFNDATDKFELFELEFPLRRGADGKIQRPEKNPARCTACHQTDPRPIWGPYESFVGQKTWHGAYGSTDDRLSRNERRDFQEYLKFATASPRFRHLLRLREETEDAPFSPEFKDELQFRPNLRLTSLLARMNARRIARMFRESPFYPELRYVLINALANCDSMTGDSLLRGAVLSSEQRRWLRRSLAAGLRASRFAPELSRSSMEGDPEKLEYLIRLFGVRPIDFAGDLGETWPLGKYNDGTYDFALKSLVTNLLLKDVLASRVDPELAGFQADLSLIEFDRIEKLDSPRDVAFDEQADLIAQLPRSIETKWGAYRPGGLCRVLKTRVRAQLMERGVR